MPEKEGKDGWIYCSAALEKKCRPPRGAATLDRLVASDHRIKCWWHEGPDGYWLELEPGWICDGIHMIHEWTVKDVHSMIKLIEPCDCDECKLDL